MMQYIYSHVITCGHVENMGNSGVFSVRDQCIGLNSEMCSGTLLATKTWSKVNDAVFSCYLKDALFRQ